MHIAAETNPGVSARTPHWRHLDMSVTERFMPASPPRQLPGMFDCMAADKRAINTAFVQANLYSPLALHILLKWPFCDAYRFFGQRFCVSLFWIFKLQGGPSSPFSAKQWAPCQQGVALRWITCGAGLFSSLHFVCTSHFQIVSSHDWDILLPLSLSHTHTPKVPMHADTAGSGADPGSVTLNSYYTPAAVTIISPKYLSSVTQDKNTNLWIQFINKQKGLMFKTRCAEVNFGLITTDIYHYI